MKNTLLYISTCLFLLSISFNFKIDAGKKHLEWLWKDAVQVPVLLVILSIILLMSFFYFKQKEKPLN